MISIGHGLACGRCMRCKGHMAAEYSTKSGCNASLDISPPPILQRIFPTNFGERLAISEGYVNTCLIA
jgi:hypothetical protein